MPKRLVDGQEEVQSMEATGRGSYVYDVQTLAIQYVWAVNTLCERNERIRDDLDKPNIHRLVEFAFNSLPMMGHTGVLISRTHIRVRASAFKTRDRQV